MAKSNLSPQRLSEIMVALSFNQYSFAAIFKVGQPTVSRWLSGHTAVPGYVEAWLKAVYPEILED